MTKAQAKKLLEAIQAITEYEIASIQEDADGYRSSCRQERLNAESKWNEFERSLDAS